MTQLKYIIILGVLAMCYLVSIKGQTVLPIKGSVIFEDDFSTAEIGKFPSKWTSNRSGEVLTLKDFPGKWFKMHSQGTYLPQINQVLPKSFIVEFDYIYEVIGDGNNLTEITLYTRQKGEECDVLFPGSNGLKVNLENFLVSYRYYDKKQMDDRHSGEFRTKIIQEGKKVHVSIRIQKQRLQLYVNDLKLLDVTQCPETILPFEAMRFHFWGSQAEPLIGNFKFFGLD